LTCLLRLLLFLLIHNLSLFFHCMYLLFCSKIGILKIQKYNSKHKPVKENQVIRK
uniref:Ovule protein n=1 Tax=Haemonchus placei TaxID=6290 RepID=A0A0N4VX10_HAEPC